MDITTTDKNGISGLCMHVVIVKCYVDAHRLNKATLDRGNVMLLVGRLLVKSQRLRYITS
jgi:hypothetical protein